jgi:hypothetical protein
VNRRTSYIAAATPLLGCVLLAGLAIARRRWFDAMVHEDSPLEWGEVCAYGAAAVISARVAQRRGGFVGLAYGLLAIAALGAIGEELSWDSVSFT